ncbi:MAG: DAK2 domain-containing protein, partial [Lachnospiraceae bacterium]|nr:DAK2 domain-containing protein [Lachnospiraceae bacterium]
ESRSRFTYDMAYTVVLTKNFNIKQEQDFLKYLESMGEKASITVEGEYAAMKVSTDDPGLVLQRALNFGELTDVSIKNVKHDGKKPEKTAAASPAEEEKKQSDPSTWKDFGFVTISVGDGISAVFKDLGVDEIISGGQTMNPSTDDILHAIEKIEAKTIYVLPNNKNIIMAANQARDLTKDKEIIVVPSKTVPQGIAAIINCMPEASGQENLDAMTEAMSLVSTGQVTYAVRDTSIDDKEIHKDDIMGIGDKGLLAVGTSIEETTLDMIDEMMKQQGGELVSIYYGEGITQDDADALAEKVREKYGDCDVELVAGGQPIYYYLVSVE